MRPKSKSEAEKRPELSRGFSEVLHPSFGTSGSPVPNILASFRLSFWDVAHFHLSLLDKRSLSHLMAAIPIRLQSPASSRASPLTSSVERHGSVGDFPELCHGAIFFFHELFQIPSFFSPHKRRRRRRPQPSSERRPKIASVELTFVKLTASCQRRCCRVFFFPPPTSSAPPRLRLWRSPHSSSFC